MKAKLSKAKRNNQKRNKLVKQGTIKKGSQVNSKKLKKHLKNVPGKILAPPKKQDLEEEEESDHGADMLEMVDQDDLEFLKTALTNRSYTILNKIRYTGSTKQSRKRKNQNDTNDETLENDYEETIKDTSNKRIKHLLPIKTKDGFVPQQIEEDIEDDDKENLTETPEKFKDLGEEQSEEEEIEEFVLQESGLDISKPIAPAQLLAARADTLRNKKIHIGSLSAGLLENPEEKVTNLRTLLKLMDDETPEVFFTVRKLVIVSLVEIFKDILPSYEIKKFNPDGIKLKKDTLKLQKYEENLLIYYKKFLQKLEKYCFWLVKKKGDTRKLTEEQIKLAELSIQAMCDLLVAHPYFNYAQNIAQVVVLFLTNAKAHVRKIVKNAVETVFREDRKEEITLKILRLVNNYLKSHTHIAYSDMLEILLVLNLKDVNLDQEKEQEIKDKQMKAKKMKLLEMSKKEKKRKKKLKLLEKEMLETKAEESKQVRSQNLTEITKIIFNIYFRILKNSNNTKLLGVCLEGLAKFAHCINLEYYVDIVKVLGGLLKEDWLGYREQLHCIQTIFIMLSGQGEAINIDPTSFYGYLYKDLLKTHAGRNHENCPIALNTLVEALLKRRKKITNKRMLSFVKRLATLSLQLLHNGTLGSLCLIKTLMQLQRSIDVLLDLDNTVGEGKFLPEIEDPEYTNASSTALFETTLLGRHYHPIVKKFGRYIASGVPTTGDGCLAKEYAKLTVEQFYSDFSMSEMAFNPSVPVLRHVKPKVKSSRRGFADAQFSDECQNVLRVSKVRTPFWISV